LRNFRILHENGATYTFQYLYRDITAEYAVPESKAFFESIKIIAALTSESQFTREGSTTGKAPSNNNRLYIGIGAVILILLILYLIFRKRRKE
jgi:LPXTG-motif cell wall-anchored protein